MKLYVIEVTILIQSKALGDTVAKANWSQTREYKFETADEREAFVERIQKINTDMCRELGIDADIFTAWKHSTEYAHKVDDAVRDVLHRFAHRHQALKVLTHSQRSAE
jgi:exonuclease III